MTPAVRVRPARDVDHRAARWWSARGCCYAAALALLDAGDAAAIRRASRMLDELGAHGLDVADGRRAAVPASRSVGEP